ncbi:ATP-dependent DNA ligase [Russula compacta]|nr:ATP-dependent DNA ligase [Russula compacta]
MTGFLDTIIALGFLLTDGPVKRANDWTDPLLKQMLIKGQDGKFLGNPQGAFFGIGICQRLPVPSRVIIDVDRVSDTEGIQEIPLAPSSSSPSHPLQGAGLNHPTFVAATTTATYPASFVLDTFFWPTNQQAPYSFLVHALCALSATRSRIAILNILTNALRALGRYHPPSLLPSLYLLSTSLAPPYVPVELGLGPSIISKAIQHVSGITPAALKRLYNQTGDPGDVAFLAKCSVRTLVPLPPLSIQGVYDTLLSIAHVKGKGATTQKQAMVEKLLVAARGEETRYLVRTLSQHIRVGVARTTILAAFARALVLTPPAPTTHFTPSSSSYTASSELVAQVSRASESASKKEEDGPKTLLVEKFVMAEALLKKVFVRHPNYDHIVSAILEAGLDGLAERVLLTVGVPLQPTLGSPMRSLDDVYGRVCGLPFTAEFKYDGQRVQIHAENGDTGNPSVSLFSRHLEDMTEKYPDVVYLVQQFFAISQVISSFIVDAEIVAIDASGGSLKSFQQLSNRARKDVKLHEIKVSVCVYAFDLMYLNGQSLLQEPFRSRRRLLRTHFPAAHTGQPGAARFDHVESCESEDGREAIEEFWLRAVDSRCEGLMIKLLDHGEVLEGTGPRKDSSRKQSLPSTYEPDKRTSAWLKLKKDYVTGLGDTLDVVPIGAWHGNGRKAQWWSPVLLAIRDTRTDKLVAMCKCMSGFSDSFYRSMKDRYSENSTNCSKLPLWGEVEVGGYSPSVYFQPHEVWEIRGADVTLSPVSVAAQGLVSEDKGLSLRFPRFIRVREDKSVEQASSTDFLAGMCREQQERGKGLGGADDGHLIDPALSDGAMDDDWENEFDE